MSSCNDCKFFKVYRGSRDRWGIQQEPDDYECTGNPTEAELDKYFCDGHEWSIDGCSSYEPNERWWDDE